MLGINGLARQRWKNPAAGGKGGLCLAPCIQHPSCLPLWLLFTGTEAPKPIGHLRLAFLMLMAGRAGSRKQDSKTCYIQMHLLYPNTRGLGKVGSQCKRCGEELLFLLHSSWEVSPLTPWSHIPIEVCSCSLCSIFSKELQAASTRISCNRDPALLCFPDNLFHGTHSIHLFVRLRQVYLRGSFGEDLLTSTAAKLWFHIVVIILFKKPCGASLLWQSQRLLEVSACGTAVVVIPVGYSYISLYSSISKIPPLFGQEVGSLLPTLPEAGLQRSKEQWHRQTSLLWFVMK